MLVLTREENLHLMRKADRWAGDGTFRVSPKLFTQLYTIHSYVQGFTVPCIFALLPDKLKETYKCLFSRVKDWLEESIDAWLVTSCSSSFSPHAPFPVHSAE